MKAILEIKNISKNYKNKQILKNASLKVYEGEILSIVGPSGSGKTSLLKMINGLIKYDEGLILYKGKNITEIDPCELRQNIGIVFQDYNLFDNMNVIENLIVGLKHIKKMNEEVALKKAREYLVKFNLSDKENNYPDELSGGEKQRISLIRTLLINPDILLLDEPTSALDKVSKKEILDIIKKLSKEGITIIIVSHEEKFVKTASTRIINFDNCKLKEVRKES